MWVLGVNGAEIPTQSCPKHYPLIKTFYKLTNLLTTQNFGYIWNSLVETHKINTQKI